MLRYVTSSLFDSPAQTLVNTVNTVGVMGKGIAAEFKRRYPEMYEAYRGFCEQRLLTVGKLQLYRTPNKWVLNFPTKEDWRRPSKLEWIELGLKKFAATYTEQGITSAAFPMLGCGNGQLKWDDVRPVMEQYLKPLTIPIFVHLVEAKGVPEHVRLAALEADLAARESISFLAFWNDVRVAAGDTRVEALGDDEAVDATLRLHIDGGRAVDMPRGAFEDLFHMLRLRGALRPNELPLGLHNHGDHVVQLLLQLPYLNVIEFDQPRTKGVRFAPRPTRAVSQVAEALSA